MNLYVGNLSYDLTEDQLAKAFGEYGTVSSVRLITDRDTGRARGFGFVEMADASDGLNAIDNMNDRELDGRRLVVNEAKPKRPRR